ncbi:MAG TPA: TolC family protein [Myxococcota bacterium]|nr:TolC family protein [Myxococcota bacterium]HOC98943.1 TolC family protein [Myxococcota bacterium]HPV03672.1 TolC family protein [Myxococcota bacterium]
MRMKSVELAGRGLQTGIAAFTVALAAMAFSAVEPAAAQEFTLPQIEAPAPGPVMTLNDAVGLADSGNRSILALRQDIVIASEKLRSSWSGLLPMLYGNMDWAFGTRQTQTGGSSTGHQLGAGLTLTVPLIDAQKWLGMKTAEVESDLVGLQVEESRQILLYSVAEAYYQAATALSLIDVYRAQYDAAAEHMKLAEGRLSAGVGNIMDVRSAQADMIAAWTGMVQAGYSLSDAREALALLIGRDDLPMPVSSPDASGKGLDIDQAVQELAREVELPSFDRDAVDSRWDMKVLAMQKELQRSELKAGYMPFVPRLNGFFNYDVDILGDSSIPNYDRNSWRLGLSLSIPLFDYSIYPGLRQKRAAIRQTELRIDELRAEGRKAVSESARKVVKLGRMMAAARVKAAIADDLLSLAEADYANGTGLAIAVTDARRTSQSAHVELATATWEYQVGLLKLNRELGVDIRTAVTAD